MKIKSLHIESYKHLQNLQFDFTYPEGHEKEGKPLEKICFIGQSATGKTKILELIYDTYSELARTEVANGVYIFSFLPKTTFKGDIKFIGETESVYVENNKIFKNEKEYPYLVSGGASLYKLIDETTKLLYFTTELISKQSINIFNNSPVEIVETDEYKKLKSQLYFSNENFNYKFDSEVDPITWLNLMWRILDYRKKFTQFASELIHKGSIGDFTKLNKDYEKWGALNPNTLIPFSQYFNPILEKLNLEVDLVNTEYPVPIKSKINDDVIPVSALSTGTKGLLLSMFPLFQLDTKDAMILIDEPERSLFPDLQIDLMSHYKACAPESQFIVATHSPFIAASFEPEERFILYFNSDGKIAVKRGEAPIGDDPNDMLSNDFNVNYYNEFGKQAYKDYLDLKKKMAEEKEPTKKKELLVKLAALGNKYNF